MQVKEITIEIVSIATPCTINDNQKIKELITKNNFKYNFFNEEIVSIAQPINNYFPSCDAFERFKSFKNACENPDSQILWCNRGGYGSAEILPFLYQMSPPKKPKILIGFSDIVSISTFVQRNWGWHVICAPMLSQMVNNKVSQLSQSTIFDVINGKIKQLSYKLNHLSGSKKALEGAIVGGCLSVLSGNFATKNQLNWRNKILFLEDEGEDGERLDRYLTQIAFIINETNMKPRAILLGNFNMANEFGKPQLDKIKMAIAKFCQKIIEIPIWQESSNCLGHSFNQMPLFLGPKTKITNDGNLIQKINLSFFSKKLKI